MKAPLIVGLALIAEKFGEIRDALIGACILVGMGACGAILLFILDEATSK